MVTRFAYESDIVSAADPNVFFRVESGKPIHVSYNSFCVCFACELVRKSRSPPPKTFPITLRSERADHWFFHCIDRGRLILTRERSPTPVISMFGIGNIIYNNAFDFNSPNDLYNHRNDSDRQITSFPNKQRKT